MQNVNFVELAVDGLGGLAGIYILKNYWSQDDLASVEIVTSVGIGFLLNILFMASTPMDGFLHAIVGGLLAWYFFDQIAAIIMPL